MAHLLQLTNKASIHQEELNNVNILDLQEELTIQPHTMQSNRKDIKAKRELISLDDMG
jgi:hypothetical protein